MRLVSSFLISRKKWTGYHFSKYWLHHLTWIDDEAHRTRILRFVLYCPEKSIALYSQILQWIWSVEFKFLTRHLSEILCRFETTLKGLYQKLYLKDKEVLRHSLWIFTHTWCSWSRNDRTIHDARVSLLFHVTAIRRRSTLKWRWIRIWIWFQIWIRKIHSILKYWYLVHRILSDRKF